MTKPLVAIVGRPNVGKSTLFNRLVRHRLAIVEDIPGTTRDRVYADASWWGHDFTVIDTGGLEPRPESGLHQQVKRQVELAVDEADVIVLMVDVLDGVTPADLEAADLLRKSGKSVVLVANKVDSHQRQAEALEFYELGLGEPVPVSAYHGRGIDRLLDRLAPLLPAASAEPETPGLLKVAIAGRPNVGKSMLFNALLGQERVIVDESPGTTRDAIDTRFTYEGQPVLLIDTAGIRRRGRVETGIEQYSVLRALRAVDRADVALLVIDISEGMTDQDLHIAGYIRQAFKGMVLVANKWDLAEDMSQQELSREFSYKLRFLPGVPILFTSALTGQGVSQVVPAAQEVRKERLKRIAPPELSSTIKDAVARQPPPPVAGRRLKLYSVAQSEVNPPTFVFSVNNAALVHFSYERYLENCLRRAFGFAGTPLRLIFRGKGKR